MKVNVNSLIDKIVPGDWGKEDKDNTGIKVIRTTNFTNVGKIDFSDIVTRIITDKKIQERQLIKGDIIIEKSGGSPNQPVGRVVYFDKDDNGEPILCNNFTSVIRCKSDVNSRYIFYYLFLNWNKGGTRKYQNKTTGILNLKLEKYLEDIDIDIPSLDEQNRIVSILDKADEIRQKKKLANDKLDEFLNSKFFEIFGNPESNPHGWNVEKLENITNKITDGVHSKPKYTDNGIPFISVKDITTKKLLFDDCKFISKEAHVDYCKRCKPEYEDILYTKVGATYGRACVVDTDKEFSLYVSVALIKPKKDIINPYFLKAVLNTDSVKKQADKRIKGIGVPDLHLVEIKSFLIPVPPMAEQIKFLRIVEKVEAQKQKNEQVIEQMNNLFNSLSQKAFEGELRYTTI